MIRWKRDDDKVAHRTLCVCEITYVQQNMMWTEVRVTGTGNVSRDRWRVFQAYVRG